MIDDSLAAWLALREPFDAASRSEALARRVVDAAGSREPLRLVDLATGTGSNIRYFLERFPGRSQHWLAIDRSPTLLGFLPARMSAWAAERGREVVLNGTSCIVRGTGVECRVDTRELDLARLPDGEILGDPHVITASALLDLVSEEWLRSLAARCRQLRCAALFAITYDGRSSRSPIDEDDERVLDAFNRHQRTDKGLGGRAMGPAAVACVVRTFTEMGYTVRQEISDWSVRAEDAELQRQLIDGWAHAAAEIAPDLEGTVTRWRARRLQHVDAGRSGVGRRTPRRGGLAGGVTTAAAHPSSRSSASCRTIRSGRIAGSSGSPRPRRSIQMPCNPIRCGCATSHSRWSPIIQAPAGSAPSASSAFA